MSANKELILACIKNMCPSGYICVGGSCYLNGSPYNRGCDPSEQSGPCIDGNCEIGYDCFGGFCCPVGPCPPDQQVGSCVDGPCMIGYTCSGGTCCPV